MHRSPTLLPGFACRADFVQHRSRSNSVPRVSRTVWLVPPGLPVPTAVVGRGHFARFLVERGHAADGKAAFRKYLGFGKCGYVAHRWVSLGDAIGWIRGAGGHAVLAHPYRYRLAPLHMHALLDEFKQHRGQAIELCGGVRANPLTLLRLAKHFGFNLSAGSDFHAASQGGYRPGRYSADSGRRAATMAVLGRVAVRSLIRPWHSIFPST